MSNKSCIFAADFKIDYNLVPLRDIKDGERQAQSVALIK